MDAYALGYIGVLIAKGATGELIGVAVYMARLSLLAAITGRQAAPDPMGVLLFATAGAIIALTRI